MITPERDFVQVGLFIDVKHLSYAGKKVKSSVRFTAMEEEINPIEKIKHRI